MQGREVARSRTVLVSLAVFCVLVGVAIGMTFRHTDWSVASENTQMSTAQKQVLADLEGAFSAIADNVTDAVVFIKVEKTVQAPSSGFPKDFEDFFGERGFRIRIPDSQPRTMEGQGTGMIVRSDGYILTNDHVVGGADTVTVVLEDGREFTGEVKRDYRSDLAIVKIKADGLPTVDFGDSDKVEVGQWAVAIGNPFGLSHTMTVGVISASGREQSVRNPLTGEVLRYYPSLIQTDASINPGNSGGPLLNVNGEVVGVNVLIESPNGVNMGIGFAIPSNQAKYVADQLIEKGAVKRGYLGVYPTDLTPSRAERFGVKSGCLVETVSDDTPASKAGIKPGDVITEIGGNKIESALDLRNLIGRTPPGTSVEIKIVRDKKTQTVKAKLDEAPDLTKEGEEIGRRSTDDNVLGIEVEPLTGDLAKRLDIPVGTEGVAVSKVKPGSAASRYGITPGFVIYRINDDRISSVSDFEKAVRRLKPGELVVVYLRTPDSEIMLDIPLRK